MGEGAGARNGGLALAISGWPMIEGGDMAKMNTSGCISLTWARTDLFPPLQQYLYEHSLEI